MLELTSAQGALQEMLYKSAQHVMDNLNSSRHKVIIEFIKDKRVKSAGFPLADEMIGRFTDVYNPDVLANKLEVVYAQQESPAWDSVGMCFSTNQDAGSFITVPYRLVSDGQLDVEEYEKHLEMEMAIYWNSHIMTAWAKNVAVEEAAIRDRIAQAYAEIEELTENLKTLKRLVNFF